MADRILPSVKLIFACDDAVVDLADEKWALKHPWYVVELPAGADFPFDIPDAWVFVRLADGVGTFDIGVELVRLDEDGGERRVGRSRSVRLTFSAADRWNPADMAFEFGRTTFDRAGIYELRAVAGYAPLDGTEATFRVFPARNFS